MDFNPEKINSNSQPREETLNSDFSEQIYEHSLGKKEKQILEEFSEEQQETIKEKQEILSPLCYHIGKDFKIPVELNQPGKGWEWDFKKNVVRIDPQDLLE